MATEFVDKQWRIPNSWNVDESNQGKISNYSMGFDGSGNDSITIPSYTIPENSTVSFWVKSSLTNPQDIIISGAAGHYYPYLLLSGGNIKLIIKAGGTSNELITNVAWVPDTWFHIAITGENGQGAGSTATYYINGVSKGTSLNRAPTLTVIGNYTTSSLAWNGQIDQVCFFDYALSASQVSTLYGNNSAGYFQIGNPMALTPNPVVFYPLGDQDVQQTVDSTDWRILNQVATGGDVFQSVPLRTTNAVPTDTITSSINYNGTPGLPDPFTVSFWMKDSVVGNGSVFFDHDASTYTTATPKGAFVYFAGGRVLIYLKDNFWRYYSLPAGVVLTDNDWRNIVVYVDPTSITLGKVWIDGTLLGLSSGNGNGTAGSDFTAGFRFYLNNFGSNVMYFKDYEIDNAGATLLYNNGAPLLDTSTLAQAPDHWWKLNASDTFDIATSTWTIKDHVGSENGTSVNMDASNLVSSELPNTGGRQGYSPWAIELNGTDQLFNCSNDSSLQITGAMTVSYWFKGQGGSGTSGGVGKLGNTGSRGFLLGITSSGNITFYIAPTASSIISAGYSHTTDTNWHHIVGVFNPSTSLELYFDGQLVDTTPTSTSSQYNAVNNLQIGARGDSTGFFDGQLSNVAIWNTNLSSSQISTMYNNGIPGDISSLNPLAWWELGVMTGFNSSTGIWTAISNTKTNYAAVSEANMTEDDLVNGPGYSTNATGTSTLVLEKQAPYSFNNALSENMAISNRDDSQANDPYPLIVELDLTGETSSYDFITPRIQAGVTYPFTVDWGDGNVETIPNSTFFLSSPNVGRLSHTYDTDTYPRPVVQVGKSTDVGQVVEFRVNNGGSKFQLFDLKQFGQANFTSFNLYSESPGINILVTASDNLKFEGTSFASLLDHNFNSNPSTINSWDISTVNTANRMFYKSKAFNQDLNNWDTSSTRPGQSEAGIINLTSLTFVTNPVFNGDVSNWFTTRSTSINQTFS